MKLQCNSMSNLPQDIPSNYAFRSLTSLNLSHNLLVNPFHYLHHIPSLENLDVSFNKIKSFPRPSIMSSFQKLHSLDLSSNCLQNDGQVFFALSHCPVLTDLIAMDNLLNSIPREHVEKFGFPRLQTINLTHNKIKEETNLVSAICKMRCLTKVILIDNPITETRKIKCINEMVNDTRKKVRFSPLRIIASYDDKIYDCNSSFIR